MKYLFTCTLILTTHLSNAQQNPGIIDNKVHKIVMQFTMGDSLEQVGDLGADHEDAWHFQDRSHRPERREQAVAERHDRKHSLIVSARHTA